MPNSEPDIRRGQIRWPNEPGGNPNAVRAAAMREAESAVAPGEMVLDLQLEGGVIEKGNDAVMVWSYSYQVVKPGESAGARPR